MHNENSKGPRTEPSGTPNTSLQTSDNVEPIFIILLTDNSLLGWSEPFQNTATDTKPNMEVTDKSGMFYGIESSRQAEQY